ncbi:MAG: tRNA (adenosine(37)-N6)-threonylcarbamoyltransferase complex ATPase subunit type 1 TsaE [Methylophilus sp.]
MIKQHFTQVLKDETATIEAGKAFAAYLPASLVVFLHGNLGAGKTTFVRGVLQGLGHQGKVKSPTYTIVEPYKVFDKILYHFDLYRFNDEEEWEMAGFREYFNDESICMIEWPEKAATLMPNADIDIELSLTKEGRCIKYTAHNNKAAQLLSHLENNG